MDWVILHSMNYSLFLARRLSLSSGGRKSSPAVKVAITAVALSIAVMLASVAVVIGFKHEIRKRVIGFNSHISLYALPSGDDDSNILTLTPTLKKILDDTPFISDYALEISIPAILKTSDDFKGVYLRSLDGSATDEFLRTNLEEGTIPDYSKASSREEIVISRIAADQLGLHTGDKIDTYFISDDVRVRRMKVAGIYNSHFDSYDRVLIYGSLELAQSLSGLSAMQGSGLRIHTDDFARVDEYSQALHERLLTALASGEVYRYYQVDNARHQGSGYFNWLALLDTNVVVVLVLMAFVAIATLISGLLIIILDKKRFIGLQRALGMTTRSIRHVFIWLALKVAFYGMIIGNAIILAVIYLQRRTHFLPLDPDSYYIDFVPVEISWWAVLLIDAATLIVIWLALILPSRYVARISPAETLAAE